MRKQEQPEEVTYHTLHTAQLRNGSFYRHIRWTNGDETVTHWVNGDNLGTVDQLPANLNKWDRVTAESYIPQEAR